MGSPSSFRRKRPFISLNSSASIESLASSKRARARARANHAKNDAQKGCTMQLNGITLKKVYLPIYVQLKLNVWLLGYTHQQIRISVYFCVSFF